MSKLSLTVVAVLGLTVLAGCQQRQAPAAEPVQPIYAEPITGKVN